MIVKWNNNIVDYKCKVFFLFFLCYKSILFFMLVYVLKKKEHATYDIRDSYYKPVAPALCWCNPPASAPSHRAGLEPGFPARDAGSLTRNAKVYSLERQSVKHHLYWYTHLSHWHPTVGINAPPENLLFLLFFVNFFVQSVFSTPRCRSHWLIQAIKSIIRV